MSLIWNIMPLGASHGWGICGKYLTLALKHLTPLRFLTESLASDIHDNPAHNRALAEVYEPLERIRSMQNAKGTYCLNAPVLQTVTGSNLKPWWISVQAPRLVGYTFFERTRLAPADITAAREYFDWIAAGSAWCEDILRNHGLERTSTVIQGIDPALFHPGYAEKKQYRDQFAIFSGGKLEFRKGQDLVLRAFKVMQDKYSDVILVNAWYNMWDESLLTMRFSPYIRFDMPKGDYFKAVNRLLEANQIDPARVVTLGPKPHGQMAAFYADTDIGLFPNRCEGGTNLVLMEYMACAKPAVASYGTGHRDILTDRNSLPIRTLGRLDLRDPDGRLLEQYADPNLDEIVSRLEWAYLHRDELKPIGLQAGQAMQQWTWQKAAEAFLKLLQA
ncbi:MAG: glycosyltransferase [Desulfobacteraceae bacterium]|nr:MAG: glycosyltransferase [Desulfobacteraceae bacterium]